MDESETETLERHAPDDQFRGDGARDVGDDAEVPDEIRSAVDDPAELIRIGTMLRTLTDEVSRLDLDQAGRDRLAAIQERAVAEVRTIVSGELAEELDAFSVPLDDPSGPELRVAQAQLSGWLEGLLRGIQAALFQQQAAAQQQLRQLAQQQGGRAAAQQHGTGQYL